VWNFGQREQKMQKVQRKMRELYHTRIAIANDVFRWIETMANEESGGSPEIGEDRKDKFIQMLNYRKAALLASKTDGDDLLHNNIKGKGKNIDSNISYHASPFYNNYSLIYLRNKNRMQIRDSQCLDLVFVDIVKGSPANIQIIKTSHEFASSKTQPFYRVQQA
jgi:hypothetical protein